MARKRVTVARQRNNELGVVVRVKSRIVATASWAGCMGLVNGFEFFPVSADDWRAAQREARAKWGAR